MTKATNAAAAVMCSIMAYDNFIVVSVDDGVIESLSEDELLAKIEGEGWSFKDTATTLGISPEALELLGNLSCAADGDPVDLNWTDDDNGTFTYNGGPHSFFHPEQARVNGEWGIRGYVEIENNVPQAAIDAMDVEEFFQEIAADLADLEDAEQATPAQPTAL